MKANPASPPRRRGSRIETPTASVTPAEAESISRQKLDSRPRLGGEQAFAGVTSGE